MKLTKRWEAAHTEYFLVCRGEPYYNGACYRSEASAQKDADAMNARRNVSKYGKVIVDSKERAGAYVLEGTLEL